MLLNWKYLRRDGVKATLLLLALLVSCFSPFVIGNRTLLESAREADSVLPGGAWAGTPVSTAFARTKDPGGAAWQIEPFLELTKKEYLQEKTLPVWNPYQAFGAPFAANMHSQVFYPPTILLALVHSPRVYNWYLLLRLFAAGVCAYFYMRLFVSFIPALAAGMTSMFAGYYLLYISMPHLSVEVLLPGTLLSAEHLLRTLRFRNVVWFACMVFLLLTGGMPESTFLILAFVYIYMAFRIATERAFHSDCFRRIGLCLFATCSGFCFSAVLLLPFRQYVRYAFDQHQFSNTGSVTGLIFDQARLSAFTYVFPFLRGPGWDNNLRNYVGLVTVFLLIVSALTVSWRKNDDRTLSSLTCFFGAAVIAVVSKRYGLWFINSIGTLPIFDLVLYPKYSEPLLSISASALCAIGIERFTRRQIPVAKQTIALALTFVFVPLALFLSRSTVTKQFSADRVNAALTAWSILLPSSLLVALSLLLILSNSKEVLDKSGDRVLNLRLSVCLLGILGCETIFNYIVPTYYTWNALPTVASDPYSGAPFVRRLQALAGHDRIFAEDGVLFPDWPSAFGLFDIRNLDAMNYRKYMPFVRQFFPSRRHQPGDEMGDRFTGLGAYEFDNILQRRLLQLSSIKYVVTMPATPLGGNTIIDEIMRQNAGRLTPGRETHINSQSLAVGGIPRTALGEHPPYDRLPYDMKVEDGKDVLHFSYGINPAAFAICGDGVEFIVEIKDNSGGVRKLFSSFIDPRHNESLRRWVNGNISLAPYRGQHVQLLLSTNGGPKGDVCADWAFWSDFRFDEPAAREPFTLIYNNEVNIYQYGRALPRAAIYFNADVKKNEAEVLKEIASPSLDVFRTVLLNEAALDGGQRAWLKALDNFQELPVQAARIASYKSREVIIEASLDRRGILVLNDSDFPGWAVQVDGAPAKIISANYLFRGVLLEPGKHSVRFVYQPTSLRLGSSISLASASAFSIWGLIKILRLSRRRRQLPV